MASATELWVRCPECGALEGSPCAALMTGRYRSKGDPINGFHVKRTMRMRELFPDPPAREADE